MTNLNSIPPELRPIFQRKEALTVLIEKTRAAMLGEEPQMRKELEKVEKLAVQQLRELNAKIESYNAKNKA